MLSLSYGSHFQVFDGKPQPTNPVAVTRWMCRFTECVAMDLVVG